MSVNPCPHIVDPPAPPNEAQWGWTLARLLFANFAVRLGFFSFKYIGVFYLADQLHSERRGRVAFALIFGLAYLIPITWSGLLRTARARRLATFAGVIALMCFYICLSLQVAPAIAGILFVVGFGLFNPNYKATFSDSFPVSRHGSLDAEFTLLLFSTNVAAAVAGFIAAGPSAGTQIDLRRLLLLSAAATAVFFLFTWPRLGELGAAEHRHSGSSQPSEHSPQLRLAVLLCIILLTTLFWTGFELRPMSLNQLAKDRMATSAFGITITPAHLQSVNPIAYIILAPLFAGALRFFRSRRVILPPTALMGAGITILGLGLAVFASTAISTDARPITAGWFIGLYIIQTIGELLIEPMGLDFITRNSPHRFLALFVVLWECSSGIAYLVGGLVSPADTSTVGIAAIFGGIGLLAFTRPIARIMR